MNGGMITKLCKVHGYIIVFLLVFAVPKDTHSWDLAVASEGGIDFLSADGKSTFSPEEMANLTDFYVLSYDPVGERIFFSVGDRNTSIYSYGLSEKRIAPLVPRGKHDVQGISYDVITDTLYWTDGSGHSIWKQSLLRDNSSSPELVLNLDTGIPIGIAISSCKRLIFWANSNHLSASIDRLDMTTSLHKKLIIEDVFSPLAVTVDETYQKLYWTDDERGIYYKIERSNFDGTERESLVRGTYEEPFGIAYSKHFLYWTDTIRKRISRVSTWTGTEPEVFRNFTEYMPRGLVSVSARALDCSLAGTLPPRTTEVVTMPMGHHRGKAAFCLNSGVLLESGGCRCRRGYSGDRCDVFVCHNYCLNGGRCFVDGAGFADCRCLAGYVGARCERDICAGFCLNGGRCSVNSSVPLCSCGGRYQGQRCEVAGDGMAGCSGGLCSTEDENSTSSRFETSIDYVESFNGTSQCQQLRVMTIVLICLAALTVPVIVVLARCVCILRRRPRIKKRIIVSKGVKSQTPMTARPTGPSEQCEITIENCCNMNICETPCFEPNLRSTRSSSSQPSRKTDDKKKLLKNMEEEYIASEVSYS